MTRFDDTRPPFTAYGFTCEKWNPARMPRPDRHNEIELNLLEAGSLTYLLGGRRITLLPNRLAVFWAAIPHQIVDYEGDAPYFVLTLPLSEFLQLRFDPRIQQRILTGAVHVDGQACETDGWSFQRWEQDLLSGKADLEQAARWEVHARLLRSFSGRSSQSPRSSTASLSRADQLACYIAKQYQQPLTAESIAAATGLHPSYAMNLFRDTFGTTITTFITQHRISHAQRLLVTTNRSVLEIAMDAGFQSLSRFNEAFKHACGCSPRDYRKTHSQT